MLYQGENRCALKALYRYKGNGGGAGRVNQPRKKINFRLRRFELPLLLRFAARLLPMMMRLGIDPKRGKLCNIRGVIQVSRCYRVLPGLPAAQAPAHWRRQDLGDFTSGSVRWI
jgi:hypothetical protein